MEYAGIFVLPPFEKEFMLCRIFHAQTFKDAKKYVKKFFKVGNDAKIETMLPWLKLCYGFRLKSCFYFFIFVSCVRNGLVS